MEYSEGREIGDGFEGREDRERKEGREGRKTGMAGMVGNTKITGEVGTGMMVE